MTLLPFPPAFAVELSFLALAGTAEALVESATGWPGMGLVFLYSFLIAFALPGPSEIVRIVERGESWITSHVLTSDASVRSQYTRPARRVLPPRRFCGLSSRDRTSRR